MGDNSWWVGVLTALTAIGASWVTSRGNTSSARIEAEVNAHASHVAKVRDERRRAYSEMSASAHALAEVFWRMVEVDRSVDNSRKAEIINEMQIASRKALGGVTKASTEVYLQGPEPVAKEARALQQAAVASFWKLGEIGDARGDQRNQYTLAYQAFRAQHHRFIDVARAGLEVT
ncbi:hypothetical protein RFN58_18535 [Streptomyces iakyrus]|uniref:hypothetical protein n=1 Tax=Streptomyces iakyrus TaxID=68219 RepID=UPI0012FEA70B|nr:hypothetical protein [Streptomyces iakyrus]